MKKYLIYGHGGSYNHGAEAILKTTLEQLNQIEKREVCLSTHFKEQDEQFGVPVDVFCTRDMSYVKLDKDSEVKNLYDRKIYAELISNIDSETISLSIGGDNYCYDNWKKWIAIHEEIERKGAIDVLWSCSIEPSMMDTEMIEHLKSFHLITAREQLTYKALVAKGCQNVVKCADIAFLLKEETYNMDINLDELKYVSINISPLIVRRECEKGIVLQNIVGVIRYILTHTDMSIVLVPHVLMPMDNDVMILEQIKQYFSQDERVILVRENLPAAQYKYIIARSEYGIFSRTHASIAAYSSIVPSIVIGYSIKSRGIGKDLDVEDYVIPVESLQYDTDVTELFEKLQNDEERIRENLCNAKKRIEKECQAGIEALVKIINESSEVVF